MNEGNPFRVDGLVAVVTGSGSGIGEAIARELAGAGARVVVADLDETRAQRVAHDIRGAGGDAAAVRVDVTDAVDVDRLAARAIDEYGQLDAWVNNAGIQNRQDTLDVTTDGFIRILSVNLLGVLHGCQSAARVMSAGSSITNILSFAIDRATASTVAYGASKQGAWAVTKTCAVEFGTRGIRVNGVAPGWTVTELSKKRATDADGNFDAERFEALVGQMSKLSPLGVVMEPVDSARAVVYLSSPAARYLTGQVIRVNGGATME